MNHHLYTYHCSPLTIQHTEESEVLSRQCLTRICKKGICAYMLGLHIIPLQMSCHQYAAVDLIDISWQNLNKMWFLIYTWNIEHCCHFILIVWKKYLMWRAYFCLNCFPFSKLYQQFIFIQFGFLNSPIWKIKRHNSSKSVLLCSGKTSLWY